MSDQTRRRTKTVKPFRFEWCGQRGRNGFIVSEHCLGRIENPKGLGFTFFGLRSSRHWTVAMDAERMRTAVFDFGGVSPQKRLYRWRPARVRRPWLSGFWPRRCKLSGRLLAGELFWKGLERCLATLAHRIRKRGFHRTAAATWAGVVFRKSANLWKMARRNNRPNGLFFLLKYA